MKVLHVVGGYNGFHLVSPETLQAAHDAQAAADAAPYHENFGDLRRSGNLAELAERLSNYDLELADYAKAIEKSVGRAPSSDDITDRLRALNDVEFDGDDNANAPADDDQFRSEQELDDEVEDVFGRVIAVEMTSDVPNDVLEMFGAAQNPMFASHDTGEVSAEQLPAMIAELRRRGYTIDWD